MTPNFWSTIVELLRESTLIQATMALGCTATMGYLYLSNRPVPDTLLSLVMVIIGYYFGSKAQLRMMRGSDNHASRHSTGIDTGTDRSTETGKTANP